MVVVDKLEEFDKKIMKEIEINIPPEYTSTEEDMIKESINEIIDDIYDTDKKVSDIIDDKMEGMEYAAGFVYEQLMDLKAKNPDNLGSVWND